MTATPDKLTIEQCEQQAKAIHRYPDEKVIYCQLADTMREVERLREALVKIRFITVESDGDLNAIFEISNNALAPNKHRDTGVGE